MSSKIENRRASTLRRRLTTAAGHANDPGADNSSASGRLYGLLDLLVELEPISESEVLGHLLRRVRNGLDSRRWTFLGSLSKPRLPISAKVDGLEKDVKAFIGGLRKSARSNSQGTVLKLSLSDESKLGRRIVGKSAKIQTQISRMLKPEYALQETYMESRGGIPKMDIRNESQMQMIVDTLHLQSTRDNLGDAEHFLHLLSRDPDDMLLQLRYSESIGDDQEPDFEAKGLSKHLQEYRPPPLLLPFQEKEEDIGDPAAKEPQERNFPAEKTEGGSEELNPVLSPPSSHSSPLEESEARQSRNRKGGSLLAAPQPHSKDQIVDWMKHYQRSANGASAIIDLFSLCAQCMLTTLAFAELFQQNRVYSSTMASATKLASQLVRQALPLIERLMHPCDAEFAERNLLPLSFHSIASYPFFQCSRQMIRRMSVLDDLMTSMDLLILPARIRCHDGPIKALTSAHLDPAFIATGGADALVRVFNTRTGNCVAQLTGHRSIITFVLFSAYDNRLYSGSFDGTVREWLVRKAKCTQILRGHYDAILSGALSPDSNQLATGSMDRTCRIWDIRSGSCLHVLQGHSHWVKVVKFDPRGHRLVSGGLDAKSIVWKLQQGKGKRGPKIENVVDLHTDYVLDLCACSNMNIISCSKDKSIKVWKLLSGEFEFDVLSSGWVRTLSLSPDETLVASGSFDNCISIFRAQSGLLLRRLRVHNSGILKVIFLDNRTLACADTAGYVQIIDI